MQNAKTLTALFLISCISAQCTELSNMTTSQSGGDTDNNPDGNFESGLTGENITPIELTEGSFAYKLELEDQSEAVLMVVSFDDTGSQNGFQILNSESEPETENLGFKATLDIGKEDIEDNTEEAHENLRWDEENLFYFERLNPEDREQHTLVATSQNSDQKTFKVISSFSDTSQYTEINTYLVYEGENVDLRIDERDFANLTTEQIDRMIELTEDYDLNIYPEEVELFGDPSDVDGNGKINVVPTREVNGYYNKLGAFVTGYFFAGDTYSAQIHSSSNEGEVVFLIVPDASGQFGATTSDTIFFENIFEGVIAHEVQHCINFNEHYLAGGGMVELPSFNESQSHFAEDLLTGLKSPSMENFSRVGEALSDVSNVSIFGDDTGLAERGLGYLMLVYLYEQADNGRFEGVTDGKDMMQQFMASKYRGWDTVKKVLCGNVNDNDCLGQIISDFGYAVQIDDTDTDTSSDEHADRHKIDRINLRAISNDNRGTYLNGPSIMSLGSNTFTGVLEGISIAYVKISETTLNQNQTIYMNFENTDTFKAFLIQ